MSADNWCKCPKCSERAIEERKAAIAKLDADYGKIPAGEYLRRSAEVKQEVNGEQTMREDYELGTDTEGIFSVSYKCRCRKCGWSWGYEHSENAMAAAPKGEI